jgi:uncharacterized C2H2 Zn-finger protein
MPTAFECPVCHESFPSRSQLKSHAYKEHDLYVSAGKAPTEVGSKSPRWKCPQCGEAFYTKRELDEHIDDYNRRASRASRSTSDYLSEVRRRQEEDPYYKQMRAAEQERAERRRREENARERESEIRYAKKSGMDGGTMIILGILVAAGTKFVVSKLSKNK